MPSVVQMAAPGHGGVEVLHSGVRHKTMHSRLVPVKWHQCKKGSRVYSTKMASVAPGRNNSQLRVLEAYLQRAPLQSGNAQAANAQKEYGENHALLQQVSHARTLR